MSKIIIAAPLIPITSKMHSHRAAQAVIYADQIQRARPNDQVFVNMSGTNYEEDFNKYDEMYVYHGNDFSGSINLFGGLKGFPYIYNFVNFSKFSGKVYSLDIEFFNYFDVMINKIIAHKQKHASNFNNLLDTYSIQWDRTDWINLKKMCSDKIEIVKPNFLNNNTKLVMGDSHSICMYRPGWMVNSVPFKTLHGALSIGLDKFVFDNVKKYTELEWYFGNIDVRHHLLRFDDPEKTTRELVQKYFEQARQVLKKYNASGRIYELLPIENESRSIPKTGWYKGTPFHGSQQERNIIRLIFKDECKKLADTNLQFVEWVDGMINSRGELDFKYMEKPQSVHLSREYYPHWHGREWNGINKKDGNTLEQFL